MPVARELMQTAPPERCAQLQLRSRLGRGEQQPEQRDSEEEGEHHQDASSETAQGGARRTVASPAVHDCQHRLESEGWSHDASESVRVTPEAEVVVATLR